MSAFKDKVLEIIRMVPAGKVVSYGQVAAYAGLPRAAREVGYILRQTKEDLPWWRVINNAGKISIDGNMQADKNLQATYLQAEGVVVSKDYMVSISEYRWYLDSDTIQKLQLPKEYVEKLLNLYQAKDK